MFNFTNYGAKNGMQYNHVTISQVITFYYVDMGKH